MLTLGDRTQCMSAWAEELKWDPKAIFGRLRLGWSVERALTEPMRERRKTMIAT
jgi:hypothetical protein